MHTVGPYALERRLSTCEVGEVWAARDAAGQAYTVAVLGAPAAAGGWRDAFAAAASTLARSDGLPITAANHGSATPWVACAAEQGAGAAHVFLALGQRLVPVDEPPVAPAPAPAVPEPTTAPEVPTAVTPTSAPPDPEAALPAPVVPPYPPLPGPPAPRRGRAAALRLVLVASVALALGAAGGFVAGARTGGSGPAPTAVAGTPSPQVDLGLPDAPPKQPGVEPPSDGGWPAATPRFTDADRARTLTGLDGIGFDFQVPADWTCTPAARTSGSAHYRCGVPGPGGLTVGGDLVVRDCQRPCDARRRVELRRQEEAWGLRWVRGGGYTTWAQTDTVDGRPRYGLIYLSYWRSVPEDAVDREVVLRMTAPPERRDEVRRVAASVRAATFTI